MIFYNYLILVSTLRFTMNLDAKIFVNEINKIMYFFDRIFLLIFVLFNQLF